MNLTEEYRLSTYHDYGPLQSKEHVRLVRNELNGKIYLKKILGADKKPVFDFLKAHPEKHLPAVEECIISGSRLIVIEEYIEGRSLAEIMEESRLGEQESAAIAAELCRAMKPLHEAEPPIVCRDLKAENVMIDKDGTVRIVDFDIARIYREGRKRDTVLMGTAQYAAPEQFGYFQTDNRTDIYALGVLLNYMLCGRFPVEKIASGKLEAVIRKCTAMSPADRYQTVEELEDALLEAAGMERPEEAKIVLPGIEENSRKSLAIPGFRRRKPWIMCAALIGYLFLASICYDFEFTVRDVSLVPVKLLRVEQSVLMVSQVIEVFLIYNYRGWRDGVPLLGDSRMLMRLAGYVLMEFLLFLTALLICMLLELLILGR